MNDQVNEAKNLSSTEWLMTNPVAVIIKATSSGRALIPTRFAWTASCTTLMIATIRETCTSNKKTFPVPFAVPPTRLTITHDRIDYAERQGRPHARPRSLSYPTFLRIAESWPKHKRTKEEQS